MRATRWFLVTSALCLATSLSACSNDESGEDGNTPQANTSPTATEEARTDCDVTVAVKGRTKASWKGNGFATTENTSGPPAFYQSKHGKSSVSLYSDGNGFDASAVVTIKGKTYTTQPDADGVSVDDSGKGGSVDADALGLGPDAKVHVTAEFEC